jgi:hypothetical protein
MSHLLANKDNRKDTEMNFAIARTHAIDRKRLRLGYVVAAAALALAITAAVGIAFTWDSGSGPSSPASISQPAPLAGFKASQTYVYVVGSQEEAIKLERAFSEADGGTKFLYEVLVVDTPEAEANFQLSQRELTDAGLSGNSPGLVIVDTR